MRLHQNFGKRVFRTVGRTVARLVAATVVTVLLLAPADAQLFEDLFGRRPAPRQQQQQPEFNPFGSIFGPRQQQEPKQAPADYSRAPAAVPRKQDIPPSSTVVVVGDSMADWLAAGLEDAFSENSDVGILRKHRSLSGLIRYDTRREIEWPQVLREIIAADKPKFIVMMVGTNDRQSIRERPPAARPAAQRSAAPHGQTPQQGQTPPAEDAENPDPAEDNPELPPIVAPERSSRAGAGTSFEFRTEKWEAAYIKRIDATIAAMKSSGVPVFWVGLPPLRGAKSSTDVSYLNDLYRSRAERAGIVFIDIWDGFVDEAGRFTLQGPDFEGQIRRLRTPDGVYFTKPGARKLAHYVEREIQRSIVSRSVPVALPASIEPASLTPGSRPGLPAQRPLAGPVVPLAISTTGSNELLGAGPAARPTAADPIAGRVLTRGESIPPAPGRADDFSWPRDNGASATGDPAARQPAATTAREPAPATEAAPAATAPAPAAPPLQKRQRPAADTPPRPPRAISPSASVPQGTVR